MIGVQSKVCSFLTVSGSCCDLIGPMAHTVADPAAICVRPASRM